MVQPLIIPKRHMIAVPHSTALTDYLVLHGYITGPQLRDSLLTAAAIQRAVNKLLADAIRPASGNG